MNRMLRHMILTFMAVVCVSGCSKLKADNSDNIDALKAHMAKHDQTIKISPMAEAFASLVADPAQKQEMLDKTKEGYMKMGIKNIYLVTGATAQTNETVLGSLIHFDKALTLDEAKALLNKDDTYKKQINDMVVNGHFAFTVATMDGKTVTPKAVVAAFKDFK